MGNLMDHYCKSPWMSLFVYDDGRVKSCCSGQWDWGDLKQNSLEEIINSPKVIKLRQDIIDGTPNDYCSYCAGCEANAGDSQRTYFSRPEKFAMDNSSLQDPSHFELKMVDIRWNNLCQLNCVYCDTLWSTTWMQLKNGSIKSIKSRYYDSVIERVKKDSENVEAIIMGGGEPLLHKQNVELLQALDTKLSIDIMTNLSMNLDNTGVFSELQNKERVNWCISIENVGDQFEFVRHGAKYLQIRENIDRILNMVKTSPMTMMLFGTYNIHSATKLKELYKLANEIKQPIHWQTLINPEELSVVNFTKPVRQLCVTHIEDLLNSVEFEEYKTHRTETDISHSITFLTHVAEQLKNCTNDNVEQCLDYAFRRKTQEFEELYKNATVKTFAELWPELDAIIARSNKNELVKKIVLQN